MNITITDGDVTIHPRRVHVAFWCEHGLDSEVFTYKDPYVIVSFVGTHAQLDDRDRAYLSSKERVVGDHYEVNAHDGSVVATIVFLP